MKRKAAAKPKPRPAAPDDWNTWLTTLYPNYVYAPFAQRHAELWDWAWAIQMGRRPPPFVAIWPRGGAKSMTAELIAVALGARRQRSYCWYICETQDQADKHVETIASLMEDDTVARYYPEMADREIGKYGNVRGWRRQRLRAANDYTIDALGMDKAARGAKVEFRRPDLMIFDDIDAKFDGPGITRKKVDTLTSSLMPAGSVDFAVLMIQNLIIPDGVFSQIADGRADFIHDRIVSGPYPALDNFAYEQRDGRFVIVDGKPTWEGQDLEVCQNQIDTWGISAFRKEAQHEVDEDAGGIFDHLIYEHCTWDEVPDLVRVTVWVDPAVTDTERSDAMGIQADGIAADNKIYRLRSWENVTTPEDAIKRAIRMAVELGADTVGIETDQGGDTWRSVYNEAWRALVEAGEVPKDARQPRYRQIKAGAGYGPKVERASQMLAAYERGQMVHVLGTHQILEKALNRFPARKPFDLCDAAFWSYHELTRRKARAPSGPASIQTF